MSDKLSAITSFTATAMAALISACCIPQVVYAADQVTLKYATPYPLGHPSDLIDRQFIAELEKATNNGVKIEYFPAEQLGKAKDMLSVCGRGIADICDIHVTYFAGQLPYTNTIVIPLWTTAVEGTAIYQWLLHNVPEVEQEFARYGIKPLYGSTTPSYNVGTTDKPVKTLADLKGLKLKTAGGIYDDIAQRYGIVPVSIAASETYEALQHGVVQGVIFNYPSIKAYHLNDLIHNITWGMRAGGYPGTVVINRKTWAHLPKSIQASFVKVSNHIAEIAGKDWDDKQSAVRAEFVKQGIKIYDLTPEQKKTWAHQLDGLGAEYVRQLNKRGFTKAQAVLDEYTEEAKRITGD